MSLFAARARALPKPTRVAFGAPQSVSLHVVSSCIRGRSIKAEDAGDAADALSPARHGGAACASCCVAYARCRAWLAQGSGARRSPVRSCGAGPQQRRLRGRTRRAHGRQPVEGGVNACATPPVGPHPFAWPSASRIGVGGRGGAMLRRALCMHHVWWAVCASPAAYLAQRESERASCPAPGVVRASPVRGDWAHSDVCAGCGEARATEGARRLVRREGHPSKQ